MSEYSELPIDQLKPVLEILIDQLFTANYLQVLQQIAIYYSLDILTVLKQAIPVGILDRYQERIVLDIDNIELNNILDNNKYKKEHIILNLLLEANNHSLTSKYLRQKSKLSTYYNVIKKLNELGLIYKKVIYKKSVAKRASSHIPQKNYSNKSSEIILNQYQQDAFNIINQRQAKHYLLHGITGSGKTELYCLFIKQALQNNQQVLYLVPEINLTHQLINRLQIYFEKTELLIWHSNISDSQRLYNYERILTGKPVLIIGTRSAIFAPLNKLGLIIIDEEHDSSYKSNNSPFMDCRIIAQIIADIQNNILIISGSATPSLATYYKHQTSNTIVNLTHRYSGQNLPTVKIIDMRRELNDGNKSVFSRQLKQSIINSLNNQEQIILLHNRRGYTNYVFCRDCGYTCECIACEKSLTYHKDKHILKCHYCSYQQELPLFCPSCKSKRIKQTGLGIQKLIELIKNEFKYIDIPKEIIRIDSDIANTRHGLEDIWDKLLSNSYSDNPIAQIIIGTQLIAKGIDLPRVTTIGIMQAESGLYFPDYLASEKSFQLLTQIAGRAGRHNHQGHVFFQTYNPEHYAIQHASKHDYNSFIKQELTYRQQLNYPPYSQIIRILIINKNNTQLQDHLEEIANILNIYQDKYNYQILGPAVCPIEKINNKYRWHCLLKNNNTDNILGKIKNLINNLNIQSSQIYYDLEPINIM